MSVPMRSNSGRVLRIVCMTGSAIAGGATGPGKWSVFLPSARSFTVTARNTVMLLTLLAPAQAADTDMPQFLKGIEERYNHIQTLELSFTEIHTLQGRKRTERGELFLRKPGRMRWQYTQPAGKLFRLRREIHLLLLSRRQSRRKDETQRDR